MEQGAAARTLRRRPLFRRRGGRPVDPRGEFGRRYPEIVLRAWEDPVFKRRLMTQPKVVLREYGIEVPDQLDIRVVENTDDVFYLNLPAKPSEELSEDELDALTGAGLNAHLLNGFGHPWLLNPTAGP